MYEGSKKFKEIPTALISTSSVLTLSKIEMQSQRCFYPRDQSPQAPLHTHGGDSMVLRVCSMLKILGLGLGWRWWEF